MEKIYSGSRTGDNVKVIVNGDALISDHHEEHHCKFNWGYHGHGPRWLAYAILLDLSNNKEVAQKHMTSFSESTVSKFPNDNWSLSENEIKNIIGAIV